MGNIRNPVRGLRGTYFYIGQGWHRWCEFQPGDSHPHHGCGGDGVGDGIPDTRPERLIGDQQEKLDFPGAVWSGHRGVLALLLPRPADGRGIQGGTDR